MLTDREPMEMDGWCAMCGIFIIMCGFCPSFHALFPLLQSPKIVSTMGTNFDLDGVHHSSN